MDFPQGYKDDLHAVSLYVRANNTGQMGCLLQELLKARSVKGTGTLDTAGMMSCFHPMLWLMMPRSPVDVLANPGTQQ